MANYFSPLGNGVAFVDSNGNPLSGAKLFTYTAGSTTKSTVYQTNAGTSHQNPMTLDANGRPPAAIWLVGGVSYKFVLAPSNDTDPPAAAIYTWDNVSGINDTTVSVDQWVVGPTPTFVDADTFTLVGDQSSTFHVNRRLKLTVSAGTVYGYVSAVAYTTLTTVDVVLDSGSLDSGLSAVSYALLSATNQSYPANLATTDTAQTISAVKTFTADPILTSTDAGATAGPVFDVYRDSASPAASDLIGALNLSGKDSAGNKTIYGRVRGVIVDPTDTSEDGAVDVLCAQAGTEDLRVARFALGVQIGSPTGGDQGTGTINATGLFDDGVAVLTASGDQTITSTIDDAATFGPILKLFRDSATPASGDGIGEIQFIGKDAAGNSTIYSRISGVIDDPTDASEDGHMTFRNILGGTMQNIMVLTAGMQVGAPTGGDKGAGTINVSVDIYKNNTAYANPDYVFEHYYTGKIEKFKDNEGAADYAGLPSLDDVKNITSETFRLPGFTDEPAGAFKRSELILEKLEQAYLYIFQLEDRIKKLETQEV